MHLYTYIRNVKHTQEVRSVENHLRVVGMVTLFRFGYNYLSFFVVAEYNTRYYTQKRQIVTVMVKIVSRKVLVYDATLHLSKRKIALWRDSLDDVERNLRQRVG